MQRKTAKSDHERAERNRQQQTVTRSFGKYEPAPSP